MADLGLEFEEATVKRTRRSDDESFFAPLLEDAGMELRSDGPWLMTTAAQVPPSPPNTTKWMEVVAANDGVRMRTLRLALKWKECVCVPSLPLRSAALAYPPTRNPKPQAPDPQPSTLNPQPSTPYPKPHECSPEFPLYNAYRLPLSLGTSLPGLAIVPMQNLPSSCNSRRDSALCCRIAH